MRDRGRQDNDLALDPDEEATFQRLRALRATLAREEGVAAYMIFADRTLIEMARERPADLDALSRIYGVGGRKLKAYGDVFLQALWEG